MPLELFRIRSFTISVAAVFLAAFGFFATVVFLPRWFQVVAGASATESGYQILPLLGGLIISAVVSGQIVSRTGRYRLLIFGALVIMAIGLFMLSHLEATTPLPVLWGWMFVTGLGVGPTFAVFTLIVQNGVPVARLGTATSNLTFFQQVGGTVGLAITGTIFGSRLIEELPGQLASAGVPPEVAGAIAGGGPGSLDALTGVGDLGQAILASLPAEIKAPGGAVPARDRGRDLQRVLDRDREHVHARDRGRRRGGRLGPAAEGGTGDGLGAAHEPVAGISFRRSDRILIPAARPGAAR